MEYVTLLTNERMHHKVNDLYGLLGRKLGHSYSKFIHDNIFRTLSIDAYFHLFEVEEDNLENAILGLKALGASGVNVTIPYKRSVMQYLDDISEEAKKIGAVNTIKFMDGKAVGYNTDYYGFGILLNKSKIEVKGKKIVLLGNGGAADSVLQYLSDNDSYEIIVTTRNIEETKLKYMSKNVKIINYKELESIKNKDIIINCTPCGMYPYIDNSPIDGDILNNYKAAIDMIYNPKETKFLKDAAARGLNAVNGLYMLVGQAVCAQEIWNDIKIDSKIIDDIYDSLIGEFI